MTQIKTLGMYEFFTRGGERTRSTHYCAGCGHGIVHKLITEALAELGMQDETIIFNPVGCSVFGYFYWDVGNISAAHGRSPSAATGLARTLKNKSIICYQGDGDLAAIGLNSTIQAASRGERMAVLFINNANYGMTGGQMAPTTLGGMRTLTSPFGRDPLTDGYPLHVCEIMDQITAPVYIERVSVADTSRIMKAKKAIRKALRMQRDNLGYAFVEIITPCPTGIKASALETARFCMEEMEAEFPLGCFRDNSALPQPEPQVRTCVSVQEFFERPEHDYEIIAPRVDPNFKERRMRFSGYGGQGVLSLGLWLSEAARIDRRFTTWFPSYGPEQRGGAASCAVVVSGSAVGSPDADRPDLLVAMNQVAYERFIGDVLPGGVAFVDETVPLKISAPQGVEVITVPAIRMAVDFGVAQAANTIILAAISVHGAMNLNRESILLALGASFKKKPELAEKNKELFVKAEAWIKAQA
ncbi:MAG: 2-oxoacid:acceptor oxidoreductase family protein [Kiritimatiellia bacterium]